METTKTPSLKTQLIIAKLLMFLYSERGIQILGFIVATFWSLISYLNDGNLYAAPVLYIALLLYVKFLWIPNTVKERKEMPHLIEEIKAEMKAEIK